MTYDHFAPPPEEIADDVEVLAMNNTYSWVFCFTAKEARELWYRLTWWQFVPKREDV